MARSPQSASPRPAPIAPSGIVIRKAEPADAAALIAHVHAVIDEAPVATSLAHDEFLNSTETERKLLKQIAGEDNSVFLVAVEGEALVGVLHVRGGKRRSDRHTAEFGISVRRAWWSRGVGSALMGAMLDWASATTVIRRIELHVNADNRRAIRLYEKFGFVVEGRRRRAILRKMRFINELRMARAL